MQPVEVIGGKFSWLQGITSLIGSQLHCMYSGGIDNSVCVCVWSNDNFHVGIFLPLPPPLLLFI